MAVPGTEDFRRVVAEQGALRGRFVDNVYQCGPRTFLFKLKPERTHLLIDLTPGRARVVVTDEPPTVPEEPPVFGSILRRALRGGRLLGTTLLREKDRVVAIDVRCGDALFRVVVEAFLRHANLLLLDAEGTVERVLDGDAARHRGNPVGAAYSLPPPPKAAGEGSVLPDPLPEGPFAANHALDRWAREEAAGEARAGGERDTARILARLQRALRGARKDLRELADPARLREQGELLLVHFADLKTGMKKLKGVPLDPRLTPPENVDRIFQRARKATRGRPVLEERVRTLEGLIERVEAGEAVPESLLPGRKGGKPAPRRPYRVFLSLDGHRILVGKGGRDNDETTLKVAGPHDVFLHVRGTPGAHVIVPLRRGQEVPEQALLDAAHLALHYSKSRGARGADITWTRRKNVSKPRGAKPGLVTVRAEKVLHLRREPERLARLLMAGGEEE